MKANKILKSSELARYDALAERVENVRAATDMSIQPAKLGFPGIQVLERSDTVFAREAGTVNNSIETGGRLSQALETYVQVAARNDDLIPEIEFLAPSVDVSGQQGLFRYFDRSGGLYTMTTMADLERAVNAAPALVEGHGVEAPGMCKSYAIGAEIDEDACGDLEMAINERMDELLQLVQLYRLQRNLAILTAVAVNTDYVWDNTGKPVADYRGRISAARVASGYRPSCLYMDDGQWNMIQNSYERQNVAGAFNAPKDERDLASKLKLRQVVVSQALARDNSGTLAAAFANKGLLFRNTPGATRRSNDICKTFVCKDQGQSLRPHRREISEKVWRVALTWREVVLITGPLTGDPIRQLTSSES